MNVCKFYSFCVVSFFFEQNYLMNCNEQQTYQINANEFLTNEILKFLNTFKIIFSVFNTIINVY